MSNQTSPAGQTFKPSMILTRNVKIAVLAVVMILGLSIALCLLLEYLFSPPQFGWNPHNYEVTAVIFGGTPSNASNYINLTIQNRDTGTSGFTIDTAAKVNGIDKPLAAPVTILYGHSAIVKIPNVNWNNGQRYSMELLTEDGTRITYVANAP